MNILFVCTHNRCRSILAEAICNSLPQQPLRGFSAGSQPAGEVHPLSLQFLHERSIATDGLASQSWQQFEHSPVDLVITVCDSAAGESCPLWMGKALKYHWGLPDPSKLSGSEEQLRQAFFAVMDCLQSRLQALADSNASPAEPQQLQAELDSIARRFPAPQFN